MIADLLKKLEEKKDLTKEEIKLIMEQILSGKTNNFENIKFLRNLTDKGESDDEIIAMLEIMNEFSIRVYPENKGRVIDMCGTGGDYLQTFNISTTASFVVAAAGGIVAKHGNRSSSGISGSADIFEYFGYNLDNEPSVITEILQKHHICFMYAPRFHPAMKLISSARKQYGRRTVFNLLGPLSNPAGIKNQLVGVSSLEFLDRLPLILKNVGGENIMTVHSDNGMDEFSTNSSNRVCILRNGKILTNVIDPQMVGLHRSNLKDIRIETKKEAINAFVKVLNNTANQAMIETTVLNAAGGLIVAGISDNFDEGVELALKTIQNGKSFKLLENFVADTGDIEKLKEVSNG